MSRIYQARTADGPWRNGRARMKRLSAGIASTLFAASWLVAGSAQAGAREWRLMSTATGEIPQVPSNGGQAGLRVVDLDQNGQTDYVINLWDAASLVWYRRVGAQFVKHTIEPDVINLTHGVGVRDIDGDGDLDLLYGEASTGNAMYWWENPHPSYGANTRWTRRTLRDTGGNFYHDNGWGDFDGDGASELMSWNQKGKQLLFFEVPANPRSAGFWPVTPVFTWTGADTHEEEYSGVAILDVNLDGKVDFVGGGCWFEHTTGTNFVFHEINPSLNYARTAAADFVTGGRPELIYVQELFSSSLLMYRWNGTAWVESVLLSGLGRSHTLETGDVDGDGFKDILIGEMAPIDVTGDPAVPDPTLWVLYGNGAGNFTPQVVSVGQGTLEAKLGDIDNDGDLDILANSFRHNTPLMEFWINDGPDVPNPPPGPLASDDFSAGALNTSRWKVVNPLGDGSVSVTGQRLQLSLPAGTEHDVWTGANRSLRVMQPVTNTDFGMEAKFESQVTQAFQLQGMLVEENPSNYLRFDVMRDTAGVHVFAASITGGTATAMFKHSISPGSNYFLRVNRAGNLWTVSYSYNGTSWTTAGSFSRSLAVSSAGVFAGNAKGATSPAFTAVVDYVFNTASPIVPEDGGGGGTGPVSDDFRAGSLNTGLWTFVNPVGNGSYQVSGQTLRLTVPAGSDHDVWTGGNRSARVMQPVGNTDFGLEAKFESQVTQAYQMQGLLIEQSASDYLRIDILRDTTGVHVFAASIAGGTGTAMFKSPISPGSNYFLRVNRAGNLWTVSYSYNGTSWTTAGSFSRSLTVSSTGVFAGNAKGATSPAFTAVVDYVFNTASPLVPEDGGGVAGPVSDDFRAGSLNTGLWTFVNPVGDGSYQVSGQTLRLSVPAGSDHDVWTGGNRSARVMQPVGNTDFGLEAKFESQATQGYQVQGLIIEQDAGNYMRVDFVRDASSLRLFAATFAAGTPTTRINTTIAAGAAYFLRVVRAGNQWTVQYSYDGSVWSQGGSFSYALTTTSAGVFAANAKGATSPAFTAVVDYVFSTASPIVPEDG